MSLVGFVGFGLSFNLGLPQRRLVILKLDFDGYVDCFGFILGLVVDCGIAFWVGLFEFACCLQVCLGFWISFDLSLMIRFASSGL